MAIYREISSFKNLLMANDDIEELKHLPYLHFSINIQQLSIMIVHNQIHKVQGPRLDGRRLKVELNPVKNTHQR